MDTYLFKEGRHYRLFEKLGSHPLQVNGVSGVYFAVWAPNADKVCVIGDFNGWHTNEHPLFPRWDETGIWEGFIPDLEVGTVYKYAIHHQSGVLEKGDPFARKWETPPKTASVVWQDDYSWKDKKWEQQRTTFEAHRKPVSVYELHMGSWRRNPLEGNRSLTYRELAAELIPYIKELGFTHVEFMPVMEHPYEPSWGYQITGYFAPTSRFGNPDDFKYLVDQVHRAGIGVILDWVPSHFPRDVHGLFRFDGTALYEHEDPRLGFHPDWGSYIFNYGRNEVKSFLISNAAFWIEYYHADGLRVDAVASMLYLDYSRKEGQWIPNAYGGNENLEAIAFLRELNTYLYGTYPGILSIAEESTSWPGVSKPVHVGGLGFGLKWMMGWMNDNLNYFAEDPIHRKYHHNSLTFSLNYAFTENFMLPLSHDEVVHGKGSLLAKMPGDTWQQFANLRLLLGWMYTHPGAKLLFMGIELAQWTEWKQAESLPWHLMDDPAHRGMHDYVAALNHLYTSKDALHHYNFEHEGFEWVDLDDADNSVLWFYRKSDNAKVLVGINGTPQVLHHYRVGVIDSAAVVEIFNSDATQYGGSGCGNPQRLHPEAIPAHGKTHSISVTLPPLGVLVFEVDETA
jgi:1,4-alpha-glucan branching enzyme